MQVAGDFGDGPIDACPPETMQWQTSEPREHCTLVSTRNPDASLSPNCRKSSTVIVSIQTTIELGGNGTQARLTTGNSDYKPLSWCGVSKQEVGHDRLLSRSCGENPMATN